jgi:alpha-D-xyloside xylohydrolase
MWLVAEGKRVEYAEEVYSINEAQDGKKMTLLCPTMQIRSRGDTLNRPTLTVVCSESCKSQEENINNV